MDEAGRRFRDDFERLHPVVLFWYINIRECFLGLSTRLRSGMQTPAYAQRLAHLPPLPRWYRSLYLDGFDERADASQSFSHHLYVPFLPQKTLAGYLHREMGG